MGDDEKTGKVGIVLSVERILAFQDVKMAPE